MSPQQAPDDPLATWKAGNLDWLTRNCTPPWSDAEDTTSSEENDR